MAMPTFDFSNIVRISLAGILAVVKSPIFYFSTLVIAGGVIFNQLYDHFIGLSIPNISARLAMPDDNYGGVVDFFVYMFNVETLLTIFNGLITILNAFISFIPGIMLGLLIAIRIYSSQKHLYETTKNITKV